MHPNDQSAGAMPAVEGATPSQSYPSGPQFAAYRLPFPGANGQIGSRGAGVCLEGEPAGGATPPATGTPPAAGSEPPALPTPPAKGDDGALGDAGKRALEQERTARRDAENASKELQKELDALKAKDLSDSERAIKAAKAEGATEVTERYQAQVRRSEVKAALSAAGIKSSVMDLAGKADEFAKLKVNDEGEVEGLDEAVKAFKKARGDLFGEASGDGSADGGAGTTGAPKSGTIDDAVSAYYNRRS